MANSTVHALKYLDILYMIHRESMCTVYTLSELICTVYTLSELRCTVYTLSELRCTVYTLSQTAIRILSITSFKLKQETRTL